MRAGSWRMVLLASLGGTLEYFDFMLFGIFARQIGEAVFPSGDPLVSLMLAFTTFAVGYLARPIGGLVLGSLGDRFGRRGVFLASIFIASTATLGIGLVPSYAAWGIAASIIVVALRIIQGFCLGGELPGAVTYVVESAPRLAPLVCSVVYACVTMGVAVATGIALVVGQVLTPAEAVRYGWRIAFIAGGVMGLAGYWLRRSFEESAEFEELKRIKAVSTQPFRELLGTHPRQIAAALAAQCLTAGFNGLFFAHLPAYLTGVLGYDQQTAVVAQTYGVVLHAALILAVGWLALHVAPHLLLRAGAVMLAAGAYPAYAALSGRSVDLMLLMTAAAAAGAFANATFAFVTANLFATRVRFSGIAIAQNTTQSIFGGTTPLVATALIASLGTAAPAAYLVVCATVGFLGSLAVPRFSSQIGRVERSTDMSASRLAKVWIAAPVAAWVALQGSAVFTQETPPVNSGANPYRVIRNWGEGPLGRPFGGTNGVAVDRDGRSVWSADRCSGPITPGCLGTKADPINKFDESGKRIASFGGGMFVWPHGLHVDRDGNVWVADSRTPSAEELKKFPGEKNKGSVVVKFSPEGKVLMTLGTPGVAGNPPQALTDPTYALTDPSNGDVYVAESHTDVESPNLVARISVFDRNGKFLRTIGRTGTGPGEFRTPHMLAWDSQGRLVVADRHNHRIQILTKDGKYLGEHREFSRVSGLTIDRNDLIYAADSESDGKRHPGWRRGIRAGSVKDGKVTIVIPPHQTEGPDGAAGEGIAIDAAGNIFAAEATVRGLTKFVRN